MDRREAILVRLLAVAGDASGLTARRNETTLADSALPAVVLLDGEEIADEGDPSGRPPATTPRRVTMTPEVQFRLQAKAADVGTRLNAYRAALIAAVLADTELLGLTVNGIGIRYLGSNMVAERGRSMEGGIGVGFAFTYMLRPDQLAATTA